MRNAKIIEARLADANSDYLRSNLTPRLIASDTVQLAKVILERRRSFALELLVLHTKDSEPEIISIGKIAGIEKTVPVNKMRQ